MLVNDLKAIWAAVTKKSVGASLCSNGLKFCSAHKVPFLSKAQGQARLKVASKHLRDSRTAWEKVWWAELSSSASSRHAVWRLKDKTKRTSSQHRGGNIHEGIVNLCVYHLLLYEHHRKLRSDQKIMCMSICVHNGEQYVVKLWFPRGTSIIYRKFTQALCVVSSMRTFW